MSVAQELILTLSKEEKREFRSFIHRLKQKAGRKDLELFNLYAEDQGLKPKVIREKLGYDSNNTFQGLNKRLYGHLVDFILSKRVQHDSTSTALVLEQLNLAKYCFDKGKEKLAWKCLKRAEELANTYEHFDLITHILNTQIEHIDSDYAEDLSIILNKRKINKIRLDEEERIITASGLIKKRLKDVRIKGIERDFDRLLDNVLKEFELSEEIFNHPRAMLRMVEMARSTIL
ncbi:MAG: hypothetical protein MRY83_16535, partial [Flavobacteriales bacterium]|nr:hypothetical protein [Flavobacteriales bacterium]